ncbi:MAG: hypothetical protein Q7V05_14570 [Methanoregula sp.]|nr:hypothetical protein [Methanoregula sp.]
MYSGDVISAAVLLSDATCPVEIHEFAILAFKELIVFVALMHSSQPYATSLFSTVISNRAPFPGSPVSQMVMPVIARISRARAKPSRVFFPNYRSKIFSFSSRVRPTLVILIPDDHIRYLLMAGEPDSGQTLLMTDRDLDQVIWISRPLQEQLF